MPYSFDPQTFARQMLPPILRRGVLVALLRAFITPLVWLMAQLHTTRLRSRDALIASGQIRSLVEVLRRKYQTGEGDIYVQESPYRSYTLYFEREQMTKPYLHPSSINPVACLIMSDEGRLTPDFYVHVPDYLEGKREEIGRLIEQYKPAGRTYKLIFYPYE